MKLKSIAFHRNGSAGSGFYVMTFTGRMGGRKNQHFMATAFAEERDGKHHLDGGNMAVIDLDMAKQDNVAFGSNSWRFEDFEDQVTGWIRDYCESRDARLLQLDELNFGTASH